MRLSLRPPRQPFCNNTLFIYLWKAVPKPLTRERPHNSWMSGYTFLVIDARVSLRCAPDRNQCLILNVCHRVQVLLNGYRRRRADEAGIMVDSIITFNPPLPIKETYILMEGCYKTVTNRPLSMSH